MTNGSVSLAVSISQGGRRPFHVKTYWVRQLYLVLLVAVVLHVGCAVVLHVGCVKDFVKQNGDYLMFDNSHLLKTSSETVSTLTLHPRLILAK